MVVLLVAEGMTAVRDSWELGNEYLEAYDSDLELDFDFERDRQLDDMAPPAGCDDARRAEGNERIGGAAFPAGITLCAANPDVILRAVVSGEMNGLMGVPASAAIVEMTLVGSYATPTPSPPHASLHPISPGRFVCTI